MRIDPKEIELLLARVCMPEKDSSDGTNMRICSTTKLIGSYLLEALKQTRGQGELKYLDYNPETKIVTGTYRNGGKIEINAECDSGVSMIRDIMAKM